jgi:hypothetical protein
MKYLRLLAIVGPILALGMLDAGVTKDMKKLNKSNEQRKKELTIIKNDLDNLSKVIISMTANLDDVNAHSMTLKEVNDKIQDIDYRVSYMELFLDIDTFKGEDAMVEAEKKSYSPRLSCFGKVQE